MSLFWSRVECDARLARKIYRRKDPGYWCSGQGQQDELSTIVLIGRIEAPTREAALAHLCHDFPGAVITTCEPHDTEPGGRYEGIGIIKAGQHSITPEQLATIQANFAQIERSSAVHRAWMARNKKMGRTDDDAAALIPPWPRVQSAYEAKP